MQRWVLWCQVRSCIRYKIIWTSLQTSHSEICSLARCRNLTWAVTCMFDRRPALIANSSALGIIQNSKAYMGQHMASRWYLSNPFESSHFAVNPYISMHTTRHNVPEEDCVWHFVFLLAPVTQLGRNRFWAAVPEAEGEEHAEEAVRKKRGAKPKYRYKTEAEAVANRQAFTMNLEIAFLNEASCALWQAVIAEALTKERSLLQNCRSKFSLQESLWQLFVLYRKLFIMVLL